MIKWTTILLSIVGVALAIYVVASIGSDKPSSPPPAAPPSINPFAHGIAGTGIIEAASRNIAVSAPDSGLVIDVSVQVGDPVKKGQPLFTLDRRLLEADLVRARAALAVAAARVNHMNAMPRPEELPPLQAAVDRAKSKLADEEARLADVRRADNQSAVTPSEIDRRQYAVAMARAELEQAQTQWALMKAGAWDKELAVMTAQVDQARADVQAIELRLERMIVRSPIDGQVLKRNVEPGQYAATGPGTPAAMVVGDLSTLLVRARIDEEDAPMLRDGAAGVARIRGVAGESTPLRMLRIEPLAVPKTDLSGLSTERVDTRVVEVVFVMAQGAKGRVFPGQLVDVFIDAAGPQTPVNPPKP